MVDPRKRPIGMLGVQSAEEIRVLREIQRRSEETITPVSGPKATYNLSEILNDSATMTGVTAKDVFDANATPEPILDTAGDPGTGANGFARANHKHEHPDLRGGGLHALASTLTHGFMSATDKVNLDALVVAPAAHATSHENGGADEISVAGLSGLLADAQTPLAHAHAGADITSGMVDPARLGSGGTGGTTRYLREDSTWTVPPAGGGSSATTVEVNLGATPVFSGKFTITDAAIGATSKVLCWQAPGPYTGKGTLADEAEMEPVSVIAVEPAAGSAVVKWQTPPLYAVGVQRNEGRRDTLTPSPANIAPTHKRIGRVRGNVKFSYMVLT